MDAEILKKVIELAAEQGGVDPNQVSAQTHFINDLNYDSLDRVEFAMAMEDEFELSVSDDDAERLTTIGDVVEYIVAHREPNPAAAAPE